MDARALPMNQRLTLSALALGMVAFAGRARADASPHFDFSGFYLPFGANVGAAIRGQGKTGLLLGGEVSGVHYWGDDTFAFVGGYADYLHDFGSGVHRISFGPEMGAYLCGFDIGSVLEFGNGASQIGGRARVFGSIGFVAFYVGGVYRPSAEQANWSAETGLLFKMPTLNYQKEQGWTFDMK
jgi:hypothetical protein